MTVRLNGRRWRGQAAANGYLALTHEWRSGDVIDIDLPMTLRAEPLPGVSDVVAFVYGPIVLAGRLGSEGLSPGSQLIVNERLSGTMLNAQLEIPTVGGDAASVVKRIRQDSRDPLTFRARGRPHDVELAPYYRLAHERYNLYWKLA